MKDKEMGKAIAEGTRLGLEFWMNDRCVTFENLIHSAAKEAFTEWLDKNGMKIMSVERIDLNQQAIKDPQSLKN